MFFKGKPAEGAQVLLQPRELGNPNNWPTGFPHARVAAGGNFEIETYKAKDGAPAGDYIVILSCEVPNPPIPGKDDPGVTDKRGGRYSDPYKTAFSAKIEDHAIELPLFRLQ